MGWSYGWKSKEELVKELLRPARYSAGVQILASRLPNGGRELWMLMEHKGEQSIVVALLEHIGGQWGYKLMDERMGPYYYQVPIEWLEQVPVVNLEWRQQVYAARKLAMPAQPTERAPMQEVLI